MLLNKPGTHRATGSLYKAQEIGYQNSSSNQTGALQSNFAVDVILRLMRYFAKVHSLQILTNFSLLSAERRLSWLFANF